MTERPTVDWQRRLHEQEAAVAVGTLDPASDEAWALYYPAW